MSSAPVKRGSTPVLLILLGSMFLAPRVEAQKTPPDTSRARSRYVLEGLVIKGLRLATTVGGSSAIRIRIDSIRGVPVPTLEQLLQDMPLVQTRTNSRGEVQPALRGSGDRQIAILVDGVPLTLGWDHRTDLSVIPLTAARGVTLLRGLRSVLYGPNVLGGVIEIDVGRGASRDEAPNPLLLHSALDETGGTVLGLTGGVLREREGRQWVVRGGGGYRERSGFRLPSKVDDVGNIAFLTRDGEHRLNSDFRHYDGFLSVRYIDGEGEWLSLSTSGYRVERGVPPETHGVEPRLWRYPEQNRLLAAFSAGTGHRDTPWGSGGLELSIGVDRGHNEIRSFASPAFERLDETEFGDDRTLTFRLTGDHSLRGSGTLKTAVTLADVAHDEKFVPGASAGYRQRLWSFGSELEWTSDDLSWIPWRGTTSFSFGLVVDGSDTPEAGDKPPVGRLWDGGGRFGMTSSALEGRVIVNGGVSRRSRFPALRELYSGALGRFQPNPALRAEVLTAGGSRLHPRSRHRRASGRRLPPPPRRRNCTDNGGDGGGDQVPASEPERDSEHRIGVRGQWPLRIAGLRGRPHLAAYPASR